MINNLEKTIFDYMGSSQLLPILFPLFGFNSFPLIMSTALLKRDLQFIYEEEQNGMLSIII